MSREDRELIAAVREVKVMRRSRGLGNLLGAFGKMLPKGIRTPDSMIRNLHLYKPGVKGKTDLS